MPISEFTKLALAKNKPKGISDFTKRIASSIQFKEPIDRFQQSPSPITLGGLGDFGFQGTTAKTPKETGVPEIFDLPKTLKTIQEETFRSLAAVPLTLAGIKREVPVEGGFAKALFGERPLRDIAGIGEETLAGFGVSKEEAKKLGFPVGLLIAGLDLTGFGGGKKQLAKTLLGVKTTEKAIPVLKKIGLSDDLIKTYAPIFAKAKTTKEVESGIEALENIIKTTRKAESGVKTIPKELEPLAKEARKFKSAEEFVSKRLNLTKQITNKGDELLGDSFVFKGDKSQLQISILETADDFSLTGIQTKKLGDLAQRAKGTGLGKNVINELKNYADATGKQFNVLDSTISGLKFWERIPFLKRDFSLKVPNSFSYTPKTTKSQLTDFFNQAKEVGKEIKPIDPGLIPFQKSKEQVRSIQSAVDSNIPAKTPLKVEANRELRQSEILSSLPPSNQISDTKSISKEFSKFKKAQSGIKGAFTKVREVVQDSFIRVRKLQKSVSGGAKIPDDINIDQAETLFHGRVHTRLQETKDVATKIDKDIVATAKTLNITSDELIREVDSFLHARHALERNARLGDGAAGITNAEAKKILSAIDNSPHKININKVAKQISDLNKQTLNILLDSEVIDKELFDLLNKVYKNHVPLQRVMEDSQDIIQVLSGKGFDVKGTGIRKAVGSDKPVADILTNVVMNAEQAIIRAEKNLVDLTTLRFARKHKELGLFEEFSAKAIGRAFAKEGEEGQILFQNITDPLVLSLREKGKPVFLKINDKRLAMALRGVNVDNVPRLFRGISFLTRLYGGLHTRFNYEFAFSNNVRDVQEMMVDVASRQGLGFKASGKAFKRELTFKSKKDITDFLFGRDTEGARLYKQMREDGGTTGGLGLSTKEQVKLDIENIRKLNRSKPRQAGIKFLEVVDKWNTLFEDSSRLSVYRTALERGATRKQAAVFAKEATVNFNKKGTAGPLINGLYMFSNASIQGTTKVLRAMKNPKVAGAVIGSMGAGVYVANEWNDSIDPDWRDKVTKWDRSSNLVIMLPTEDKTAKYITVPISWGLKPIKVVLEYLFDAGKGHGNLEDATQGVLTSVLEAYNPLAGDENLLNTLTPTILKVPMEISRNRAWYGNQIKPDYDPNIPASAKYFKSLENTLTGKTAITLTKEISEATNGAIEISPADVNYAFNQYIGGVGRSISKVIQTVSSISNNETIPAKERPVLSRFLKETDEETVLQRLYYTEKERANKEKAEQKVKDIRRITPIYEEAQMLIREGKPEQAQAIVDNLSEEDWTIYKKMKASDKRRQTTAAQIGMFPTVKHVQKLLKEGKKDEAQRIVDAMTDEEFKYYKTVKKQLGFD